MYKKISKFISQKFALDLPKNQLNKIKLIYFSHQFTYVFVELDFLFNLFLNFNKLFSKFIYIFFKLYPHNPRKFCKTFNFIYSQIFIYKYFQIYFP